MRFGRLDGPKPFGLQPGEDEAVERPARPGGVLDRGKRRVGDGAERPEGAILRRDDATGRPDAGVAGRGRGGPDGPALHPGRQVGDDAVGQLALGRHLHVFAGIAHRLDQQALVGLTGHDGGAAVASLEQRGARGQAQLAARLGGVVAGVAVSDEHRSNLALEEIEVGGRGGGGAFIGGVQQGGNTEPDSQQRQQEGRLHRYIPEVGWEGGRRKAGENVYCTPPATP